MHRRLCLPSQFQSIAVAVFLSLSNDIKFVALQINKGLSTAMTAERVTTLVEIERTEVFKCPTCIECY